MMKKRFHLLIYGQVQGVAFRAEARAEATALGITGSARNLANGSVEIVCEGESPVIDEFIRWCRHGPPLAEVERIDMTEEQYAGEFDHFDIL